MPARESVWVRGGEREGERVRERGGEVGGVPCSLPSPGGTAASGTSPESIGGATPPQTSGVQRTERSKEQPLLVEMSKEL